MQQDYQYDAANDGQNYNQYAGGYDQADNGYYYDDYGQEYENANEAQRAMDE